MSERFQRFLAAIAPTDSELARADRRLDRIGRRLREDFDVRRLLAVGSHWKQTAVRRHSDVDLFVVISKEEATKWSPRSTSSTVLNRVRNSVFRSYPSTGLRIDKQAIVVRFEQGAHAIDVVPAVFDSFLRESRAPLYLIPDGEEGWLKTSPDMQKNYLEEQHARSGRKLKSLVRMLKWWGASRITTATLTSLYIEHLVAACQIPLDLTYQDALARVFQVMADGRYLQLRDPLGVSDHAFRAVNTRSQQQALVRASEGSAERAARAISAELRGRFTTAVDIWQMIFNNAFPSRRL